MNKQELLLASSDPAVFQRELIIPAVDGPRKFGEVMADFQRERFAQINPALVAVANGTKPPIGRFWHEATKGCSKDTDISVCILWLLAFSRRPILAQAGASDQDQADELRKAAKSILFSNPWLSDLVEIQNWRIVGKNTGAACEIITTDQYGSHGGRPDVLIINELTAIRSKEFAENLRDNAAKVPNGLVIIATNAGCLDTWQFSWREIARTSDRWVFNRRMEPAPWLDPAEIEEAKRRNPASRFNRLFRGVWSTGSGDAIDEADLEAAIVWPGPMDDDGDGDGEFVSSLDLGVKSDHSALVTFYTCQNGPRARVADVKSWNPADYGGRVPLQVVEAACIETARKFKVLGICYDPCQGELMSDRLVEQGVNMFRFPWTVKSKQQMALTLVQAFRDREIDLYNDEGLLRDLRKISIVERAGRWTLVLPHDEFGHCDIGAAFCQGLVWALATRKDFLGIAEDESQDVFSVSQPR